MAYHCSWNSGLRVGRYGKFAAALWCKHLIRLGEYAPKYGARLFSIADNQPRKSSITGCGNELRLR